MTGDVELYRCKEWGATATTLGRIHGHIESQRSVIRFYSTGWDLSSLQSRTERFEILVDNLMRY